MFTIDVHLFPPKGYADIVRLLLEHGAKVEETNENGHTPLVSPAWFEQGRTVPRWSVNVV